MPKNQKGLKGYSETAEIENAISDFFNLVETMERLSVNSPKANTVDQEISDFHLVETVNLLPANLPIKAKSLEGLYFPHKEEEDKEEPTSANRKNVAVKIGQNKENGFFYFKHNKHVSLLSKKASIAECEVVCAAWAKFLAPECVPTMRVWYDPSTDKIVGRTSKDIPGFKTNHEVPLKEEDTIITLNAEEEVAKEIEKKRTILIETISLLLKAISERKEKEKTSIPGMSYFKGFYNRSSPGENSTKHADFLNSFLKNNDGKFSKKQLEELLEHLGSRGKYIIRYRDDESHKEEFELLRTALNITTSLLQLTKKTAVPLSAVPILELLYRKALQNKEDLTQGDLNRKIEIVYRDKTYSITAKHLDNYRIIARQLWQLCLRFLLEDVDGHNQNFSRDGWMIDFDNAKYKILFQIRKGKFYDNFFRKPDDSMFDITPYDICHFPAIRDAKFFYWAANKTMTSTYSTSSVVGSSLSHLYPNLFHLEDNEVFTSLELNPVATFHKFKQFLKYALCDETMFENIAKLHMRSEVTFIDKDRKEKNLLQAMVADEKMRIERMRAVLVDLPEFKELLTLHGEFIFDIIKEEFKVQREKYEHKVRAMETTSNTFFLPDTHPLKKVMDSIDLVKIEERYKALFEKTVQARFLPEKQKENKYDKESSANPRNVCKNM